MSKKFTYTKITGVGEVCGSLEEYGEDFEYEVEDYKLLEAVADFVLKDFFYNVECEEEKVLKYSISKFIKDNDLLDNLVDNYEEDLKYYFEDDAFEWCEG